MQERFSRVRSSTVIAAILALIITSVAAGAAGDFLVLGASNSSGSSQTVLTNSGLGAAFTLRTTNQSTNATGIFGWSSSTAANATRGVYGRADGPNSYGVYALHNGAAGNGAAIFADGGANVALDLRRDSTTAAPMKVNSTGVVANLNADRLDGHHAISFYEYGDDVPSLQTLTGHWVVSEEAAATGDQARNAIFYPVPMPSELTAHVIEPGDPLPSGCSGSVDAPAASGGNLCIFVDNETNVSSYSVFRHDGFVGTSIYGAYIRITSSAAGTSLASGTWAATAPLTIILSEFGEPSGPRDGQE